MTKNPVGNPLILASSFLAVSLLAACNSGVDDPAPTANPTAPRQAVIAGLPAVKSASTGNRSDRLIISFGPETEARYRVNEQLATRNLPNDAVGVTNAITGTVTFDAEGTVIPEESKITIDASTLKSDKGRRDNFIQKNTLRTNQFPTIDFVINNAHGLAWPLPGTGDGLFKLIGDLTIRDVTKEVTWEVSATFNSGLVEGLAKTSFTFGDFGMNKPRVAIVLSVNDLIRLELDFVAIYPQQ